MMQVANTPAGKHNSLSCCKNVDKLSAHSAALRKDKLRKGSSGCLKMRAPQNQTCGFTVVSLSSEPQKRHPRRRSESTPAANQNKGKGNRSSSLKQVHLPRHYFIKRTKAMKRRCKGGQTVDQQNCAPPKKPWNGVGGAASTF